MELLGIRKWGVEIMLLSVFPKTAVQLLAQRGCLLHVQMSVCG